MILHSKIVTIFVETFLWSSTTQTWDKTKYKKKSSAISIIKLLKRLKGYR